MEDAVHRWAAVAPLDAGRRRVLAAEVRRRQPLLDSGAVTRAVDRVEARLVGLGPLDDLLADDTVTDVVVNGPGVVWVDRGGYMERSGVEVDAELLELLIERVVAPLGRRVDPVHPVVDGRLPDGSRVHVVVPPLAVDGPCLTIRRFATRSITIEDVAGPGVARILRDAVRSRANVIVAGGTGSGKTTLLNALAAEIDPRERIVTVEDAAELRLPGEHVVRLETRPSSVDGPAAVSARDLVRNALRMRPDRLLLGEVRGGEALDLVQAMNTGHDGSLSTLHANSCVDALRRLEALVLMAGIGLPLDAVRDHIASAVDLVVHLVRGPDGRRYVDEVAEVVVDPEVGRGEPLRVRMLADADGQVGGPRRPQRNSVVPSGSRRWS
ncbi:MAG: CpaF family protein [Acidimicrobiales bacterium]|nr:CpaF family protein [Acidimicrobiales bacterium]